MRLERVHLADVPCAGPNENYRAARGHCGEYTRVLTATLCTIADGFDRLVPIVASATVSPRLAESNRSDDEFDEYDEFDEFDEFGAGDFPDANAREPLHAAYRYLRNCLHPARHPDVVRARRKRSKRPRDFEGSPSLDAFVEALGKAGVTPEVIRATTSVITTSTTGAEVSTTPWSFTTCSTAGDVRRMRTTPTDTGRCGARWRLKRSTPSSTLTDASTGTTCPRCPRRPRRPR